MESIEKIHREGGVEVMKASAGSGKTFALAREYIRLLLSDKEDNAHRHILAVTFTNKATGEMKDRIIAELDALACRPGESGYREYLLRECGFADVAGLSAAARKSLSEILNDYGSFSVSTIDRFFQQTLRAFAREAGQVSEYRIELDKQSLVSESVDRVLDSLSETRRDLLQWLSEHAIKNMESGEGYHLEDRIEEFAGMYMTESYAARVKEYGIDEGKAFSEENLSALLEICTGILDAYQKGFASALEGLETFLYGLACYEDGVQKHFKSAVTKLRQFADGRLPKPVFSSTWTKVCGDASSAFKTKAKGVGAGDVEALQSRVAAVNAYAGEELRKRETALLLLRQVAVFRIADALNREFKALLKEKNVLSLDDTNSILHDIIGGTEIPFIYEKTGVRLHHFLLDEFQDTGTVQWENFLPLLRNSIAEGCYNLVVGDVKQSIYRWRNADWNILDSRVTAELDRAVPNPLDCNWRSATKIVEFNNGFFAKTAGELDIRLAADADRENDGKIGRIYSDVAQKTGRDAGVPGSVELTFCGSGSIMDNTVAAVKEASERGFRYKDMAVVVRTNATGGDVASRLVAEGIPVVSNDSLRVSSCKTVRRLVSCLYRIDNPADVVNGCFAADMDISTVGRSRSLTDLAESVLALISPGDINRDTLYVLAFMDMVRDYVNTNGNSLHSFLKYWSEDGMKRNISSPEGSDAVTIITIHKVKGLDFPFVVLPVTDGGPFVGKKDCAWEHPDFEGTVFSGVEDALYKVNLTSALSDTYFSGNYLKAKQMMYIDSINVWYVAMTRASQAMSIIAPLPPKELLLWEGGEHWPACNGIGGALYLYRSNLERVNTEGPEEKYLFGTVSGRTPVKKDDRRTGTIELEYYSGGKVPRMRGKIGIRSEAAGFFRDGLPGYSESRRARGTVLHGILAGVLVPGDLSISLGNACMEGVLSLDEADEAGEMLSRAIASVSERGWFGSDSVNDERSLVDSEGSVFRPDRVVIRPDGVDVVDYKFGAEKRGYIDQVRKYCQLYRELGYANVRGYVWYVESGRIVEVKD